MGELTKAMSILIDEETFDRITVLAKRDRISRGAIVRDLIQMGLEDRESLQVQQVLVPLD